MNTLKELKKERRILRFKSGLLFTGAIGTGLVMFATTPLAASLLGTCFGYSPFKLDDVTREAHVRTEFDTESGKNVSKQYEPYKEEKNLVRYHTGWTEDNNQYVSEVVTYDASKLSYADIDNCMKEEKEISTILGNPISTEEVTKDDLSTKEKKSKSHYEGVFYSVDPSDTIVTPQTAKENGEDFLIFSVIPGMIGAFPTIVWGFDLVGKMCKDCDEMCNDIYAINKEIKEEKKKKLTLNLKKNSA